MLIGLTRQLTLRRAMDVAANNIANAQTSGFKAERVMLAENTDSRARHIDGPDRVAFVDEWALGRDFTQGVLNHTGRPLDMALEGDCDSGMELATDQYGNYVPWTMEKPSCQGRTHNS